VPERDVGDRLLDVIDQRVRSLCELVGELLASPCAPAARNEDIGPARPLRVVVCEDAKDICDLAANLLRADGHTVFQATSGGKAIELIEAERPDVALVDLALPDIDGSTVARTVRDRLGARAPHLVAITALTAPPRPEFDEYLMKPASREHMPCVLARVPREPGS
jgi:CheY-like chemotaxis protein